MVSKQIYARIYYTITYLIVILKNKVNEFTVYSL